MNTSRAKSDHRVAEYGASGTLEGSGEGVMTRSFCLVLCLILKSLCHLSPCGCLPWSWLFPPVWLFPVVQSAPPACVCKPCSYRSPVWLRTVSFVCVVPCCLSSWISELNTGLEVVGIWVLPLYDYTRQRVGQDGGGNGVLQMSAVQGRRPALSTRPAHRAVLELWNGSFFLCLMNVFALWAAAGIPAFQTCFLNKTLNFALDSAY